ncbi:hypothetical protein GIB67_005529 [Kingdonia uniflora]|uniref:Tubby-like F-box protein n=1 Tax=Kingdonia uniflora TaxID=39325 RepID=A0A7J7NHN0_9MAGN|nr:hypothetical protein GIB67_005529 [Kingdonia uniflora]
MSFKNIFRELREGKHSSRNNSRSRSHIVPDSSRVLPPGLVQQSRWANLPPELLLDVIERLESSETSWPARRHVVSCASVCRSWREITKETVKTPELSGILTFPISLKQPGPRDSPIQCFIRRERATSTYRLYLGLTPGEDFAWNFVILLVVNDVTALLGENGKLLLAARKVRRATSTEFIISLVADDFSRASNTYIGKLRSNFLGTKFTIYDSQPPCELAVQSNSRSNRRIHSKQVSPRVPAGNYQITTISYELNVLRTRGPRRMHCTMNSIPISALQEGGTAPTPTKFSQSLEEQFSNSPTSKTTSTTSSLKTTSVTCASKATSATSSLKSTYAAGSSKTTSATGSLESASRDPLILKNKAPRWHEQLQCWCLNFRGRVTVASVKNFQLVASVDPSHNVSSAEQEKVILQFGKIGKDIFTMDYQYPISAFQAFAICLSSFDTKPACE